MRPTFTTLQRCAIAGFAVLAIAGATLVPLTAQAATKHPLPKPEPANVLVPSPPTIHAGYFNGFGYITGTNFTVGGSVQVNVYSPSGVLISQVWIQGQSFCSGLMYCLPPGQIQVTNFNYPPCQRSYTVSAYDVSSNVWSNNVGVEALDCLT